MIARVRSLNAAKAAIAAEAGSPLADAIGVGANLRGGNYTDADLSRADLTEANNGLWSLEAERYLLAHAPIAPLKTRCSPETFSIAGTRSGQVISR